MSDFETDPIGTAARIEELEAEVERLRSKRIAPELVYERNRELLLEVDTMKPVIDAARALRREAEGWASDAGGYAPSYFDLEEALDAYDKDETSWSELEKTVR